MIKNVYWFSRKVPVVLASVINETRNFLDIFSKNTDISNFMKIRPVVGELFHAGGRTDIQPLFAILQTRVQRPF